MDQASLVLWLLSIIQLVCAEDNRETVELKTKLGGIRGYTELVNGRRVDSFLGIPFAKPPVGNLRFQKPESYGAWEGTFDGTNQPNSCSQVRDYSLNSFSGVTDWNANTNISEDCLYLNVWSPSTTTLTPKAVLVWIFGGGFYGGTISLDFYDGRNLAAEGEVVVVSMQYRLGALGFLYLGNSGAPGNVGLLDQHLALEWIFNNIHEYGGDNSRITIFGESAGAASVAFHMLSPLSKEVFHRAILQSATGIAPWAIDTTTRAKKRAKDLAETVGCTSDDDMELLHCLRKIPHDDLSNGMWTISDNSMLATPFVPVVDGYFLRQHPIDILADQTFKKVPTIVGVMKDEGAYWLPFVLPTLYNLSKDSVDTHEEYLEAVRQLLHGNNDLISDIVAYEYKYPYQYKTPISYPDILDDIMGDYNFVCPCINYAMSLADADQDVYFYQFTHTISKSPWPKWMGALHGYEMDTVFGLPLNDSLGYTMDEKEMTQRVIQMWTNFAKTGNPTTRESGGSMAMSWPVYSAESRQYVILNTTSPAPVADGLRDRKCSFWRDLIPSLRARQKAEEERDATCGSTTAHRHSLLLFLVTSCSIFLLWL